MLKTPKTIRLLALLATFCVAAQADTVVLKNGEKVEGKILAETDTEVTVEILIGASIKDERVIKKAEIEKIDKALPDVIAWKELVPRIPALSEDSLEPLDYQRAVSALSAFVQQFPQSTHAAEAKSKLASLEEEKKRVDAGELKQDGQWLSKDKVQEEKVQVAGNILFRRMTRYAAAGQVSEALAIFDAIEKNYPGSAAWPDAVELARKTLPIYKATAEQALARIKTANAQNQARSQSLTGTERTAFDAQVRAARQQLDEAVAAYERTGAKWLPLNPASERSLTNMISRSGSELTRLSNIPLEKIRTSIAAANDARAALTSKDAAMAEKKLTEALSAWPANELAKRLQPQLEGVRKEAAEMAKAEAAKKAAEEKAEAEAKLAAEKAAKPTPAPVSAAVADDPTAKQPEPPLFARPIFYVLVILSAAAIATVVKFFKRFKDPSRNILDQ